MCRGREREEDRGEERSGVKNGSGLLGPVAGGCGQVSASTWRGGRRLSESGMPQRSARNLAGLGLFFP